MTEEDQSLILGALDSLGVALADHDHEWTEGERCIYEAAVECVQRVERRQACIAQKAIDEAVDAVRSWREQKAANDQALALRTAQRNSTNKPNE